MFCVKELILHEQAKHSCRCSQRQPSKVISANLLQGEGAGDAHVSVSHVRPWLLLCLLWSVFPGP